MSIPYMPLYVGDYEADTAHLTIEEDGAYTRLLRLCWRSPGCTIPDDPAWIMRRMRVDAETFERVVAPVISEFFKTHKGRVRSPRLVVEFERIKTTYEKRRNAGAKGGRPAKALKTNETDERRANAMRKPEESNQNQNQNHKEKKDICPIGVSDESFARFWNAFADKRGKPSAARAFAKAIKTTDPEVIIAGATRYAATRKAGFGKMAQGWLSDERWNDSADQPTAVDDHLKSWGIADAKYDGPRQRVEHPAPAVGRQPADVPGMFELQDEAEPKSEMSGHHGERGRDCGVLSSLRMDEGCEL